MLPLDDLLVLDLSRVLSGPYCAMYLGDFGARVIKVERPGEGDDTRAFGPPFIGGESTYYLSINRNKESVAIDLKAKKGRDLVAALAARADVLLENFRPGVLDRLGLSYAALRQRNPRLIYCSITGFGHGPGPLSGRPGYDVVVQGMGGFTDLTGDPGGPPYKAGVSIADLVAGLNAVAGVLLALHARTRTGQGQHVDISMLDGQVALLTYHASMYLNAGAVPHRLGNRHPSIAPYQTYATADGFMNIAAANENLWHALCKVLRAAVPDLPALEDDPRFAGNAGRVAHRSDLDAVLSPVLRQRPSAAWLAELEAAGVPCGPILTVPEVLGHPQVRARDMVIEVPHPDLAATGGPAAVRLTGVPIKLSETPGRAPDQHRAPPRLGADSAALAGLLGMQDADLRALENEGVITFPHPIADLARRG